MGRQGSNAMIRCRSARLDRSRGVARRGMSAGRAIGCDCLRFAWFSLVKTSGCVGRGHGPAQHRRNAT